MTTPNGVETSSPRSPVRAADVAATPPGRRHSRSPWGLLLGVSLPLYALDQLTKWLVRTRLDEYGPPVVVVPDFFNLVHATNTGAAFSIGHGNNGFFLVLSLGALVVLGVCYRLGFFGGSAWTRAGFALLVSGVLGNLTDRLRFGHVVDFLQFDLHFPGAHPFPSFNVADSCICVAAGCFLVGAWREEAAQTKKKSVGSPSPTTPPRP